MTSTEIRPAAAGRRACRTACAAALSAVLTSLAAPASAVCRLDPNYQSKHITMNVGQVIIRDDLPIGSLLATRDFEIPVTGAQEVIGTCRNGGLTIGTIDHAFPVHDKSQEIYQTNVPGIGIQLMRHIGGRNIDVFYPHQLSNGPRSIIGFEKPTYFRVKLYKIGDITRGGSLTSGKYTTYYADGDGPGRPILTTSLAGDGIVITTPACTLDPASRQISVGLGDVSLSAFSGVGTATPPKPFDIRLNCVVKPQPQSVHIRFDATADPSGAPGVIQLTQEAGRASGVGIRVLKEDGNPIALSQFWPAGQTPTAGGPMSIRLQAQYYQTADNVAAGTANGVATFTLDYK